MSISAFPTCQLHKIPQGLDRPLTLTADNEQFTVVVIYSPLYNTQP